MPFLIGYQVQTGTGNARGKIFDGNGKGTGPFYSVGVPKVGNDRCLPLQITVGTNDYKFIIKRTFKLLKFCFGLFDASQHPRLNESVHFFDFVIAVFFHLGTVLSSPRFIYIQSEYFHCAVLTRLSSGKLLSALVCPGCFSTQTHRMVSLRTPARTISLFVLCCCDANNKVVSVTPRLKNMRMFSPQNNFLLSFDYKTNPCSIEQVRRHDKYKN